MRKQYGLDSVSYNHQKNSGPTERTVGSIYYSSAEETLWNYQKLKENYFLVFLIGRIFFLNAKLIETKQISGVQGCWEIREKLVKVNKPSAIRLKISEDIIQIYICGYIYHIYIQIDNYKKSLITKAINLLILFCKTSASYKFQIITS